MAHTELIESMGGSSARAVHLSMDLNKADMKKYLLDATTTRPLYIFHSAERFDGEDNEAVVRAAYRLQSSFTSSSTSYAYVLVIDELHAVKQYKGFRPAYKDFHKIHPICPRHLTVRSFYFFSLLLFNFMPFIANNVVYFFPLHPFF
jgi:hypothetical protein